MKLAAVLLAVTLLTGLCSAGSPKACHQRYRFHGKVYFCQRPELHSYPHRSQYRNIIVTWGKAKEFGLKKPIR